MKLRYSYETHKTTVCVSAKFAIIILSALAIVTLMMFLFGGNNSFIGVFLLNVCKYVLIGSFVWVTVLFVLDIIFKTHTESIKKRGHMIRGKIVSAEKYISKSPHDNRNHWMHTTHGKITVLTEAGSYEFNQIDYDESFKMLERRVKKTCSSTQQTILIDVYVFNGQRMADLNSIAIL